MKLKKISIYHPPYPDKEQNLYESDKLVDHYYLISYGIRKIDFYLIL